MKKGRKAQSPGRAERPALEASHGRPTAPHGHPLSRAKPEGRAHPAERKAKHKRPPGDGERDGAA